MQFSQPLQFIVPSLSPLIHSSFNETPVHGTYIHNNILFIKLIPTMLLPLLSPHTCCFGMESSPCLFSPSQTLSVQINTHGGTLEGCWQLLDLSHTQQMHPPSLAKGSWLLRILLMQDDDEHKLHRISCFTDGTWPERDHAISEMYFE